MKQSDPNPYQPPQKKETANFNTHSWQLTFLGQCLFWLAMPFGLYAALLLVLGWPFAWLLRDGLGPDSVESSGPLAILRTFQTFYYGPQIIIGFAIFFLIRLLSRICFTKAMNKNHST